jgi:tRNA pseudouridine38-40 synthase
MEPRRLAAALNGNLARDVRILSAMVEPDDFHARYHAKGKTYCYRVFNESIMSPFWARYALHEGRPLDLERMQEAAQLFIGRHDWTAFSAAQSDVQTRVRNVTALEVSEHMSALGRGRLVEIRASAEGFLRYMVRSIAGTLLSVGRGEIDGELIRRAIETGERPHAIVTAPAHGLTLIEVHY